VGVRRRLQRRLRCRRRGRWPCEVVLLVFVWPVACGVREGVSRALDMRCLCIVIRKCLVSPQVTAGARTTRRRYGFDVNEQPKFTPRKTIVGKKTRSPASTLYLAMSHGCILSCMASHTALGKVQWHTMKASTSGNRSGLPKRHHASIAIPYRYNRRLRAPLDAGLHSAPDASGSGFTITEIQPVNDSKADRNVISSSAPHPPYCMLGLSRLQHSNSACG